MNINLEDLTYDELIGLNRAIVERLKFLDSMQTQNEMMQFSPGEKVCFQASANRMVIGTLVKYNKKTVTVVTDDGEKWNISPHFLSKHVPATTKNNNKNKKKKGKVIEFRNN